MYMRLKFKYFKKDTYRISILKNVRMVILCQIFHPRFLYKFELTYSIRYELGIGIKLVLMGL